MEVAHVMKLRCRIDLVYFVVVAATVLSVATIARADTEEGLKPKVENVVSPPAPASPEEDYKQAEKAYADGDLIAAMPLYKKAADQGYAPAQATLGEILVESEYIDQAITYFRKAAEQGNAEGQFDLGGFYVSGKVKGGQGVEKDVDKGRELIVKAAEQGYAAAINAMADAYLHNRLGIDPKDANSEKAFHWIKLSAEGGNLPAVISLIQAYEKGTFGAPVDLAQAKVWKAKAKQIQQVKQTQGKKNVAKSEAAKQAQTQGEAKAIR